MRNPTFKKNKETGDWEARPFQGFHYRIIKRWLKGYVLYLNDKQIASETTLNAIKSAAREHLHVQILTATNQHHTNE